MTVKNFIKSSLMLTLLVTSTVSFAQQQGMAKRTPEERAQRQTEWMQKNLALTDDQNKKVYDIILSSAKQMDNARNAPANGDKRTEIKSINDSREIAMKGVLTGDQFQKYQQHVQEMKQQRKNNGGMRAGE